MASPLLSLPLELQDRIFRHLFVTTSISISFATDYSVFPVWPEEQIFIRGCHSTSLLQTCRRIYEHAKPIRDESFTGLVSATTPGEIALAGPWIWNNLTTILLTCPWTRDLTIWGQHSRLRIPHFRNLQTIKIHNLEYNRMSINPGGMTQFINSFLLDSKYMRDELRTDARNTYAAAFVPVLDENLPIDVTGPLYRRIKITICSRCVAVDLQAREEVVFGVVVEINADKTRIMAKAVSSEDEFKWWYTKDGKAASGVTETTTIANRPKEYSWVTMSNA